MGSLSKESLPPFGQALTGAAASALALLCVYPLDTVKTRLQVQSKHTTDAGLTDGTNRSDGHYYSAADAVRKIYHREGIRGFYAGLGAGLLGQMFTNFAYFYWYTLVRKLYLRRLRSRQSRGGTAELARLVISTPMELALGALAAAIAQLFTTPISVVATRQQTAVASERLGMLDTAVDIVRENGWTGLWKGLRPSLVLVVNPSITYGAFERIKAAMVGSSQATGNALSSLQVFAAGALAKTLATVLTYPYIMAKVRLQWKPAKGAIGGNTGSHKVEAYKSAAQILQRVWQLEGFFGWYKGMSAQITKAVLTQAMMLMIKDKIEAYVVFAYLMLKSTRA
ncbi:hypothetical protein H4R34_004539 [Dimargaris verticillata]|uniref:Mitochondrial carrier domain-containing protein n=1 Tax=Dimargaris verticillata TaxID=2761393 RepID=A0A9W8EB20_9FUNG|nr:hypothetical protein H4R34_004539 [Dimargaris verticillata]